MPDFRIDPDVAARLLDDPVDGRETETRPLAYFLCRKERLEDLFPRLGAHAGSGIADSQHHVSAGFDCDVPAGVRLVEVNIRCFDDQFAALWHRITGVD